MLGAISALPVAAQITPANSTLGADILPRGRFAVIADLRTTHADREFDASGNRQSLLSKYNNISLNSAFFPLLAGFGPGATLGRTSLAASFSGNQERLIVGYGFSENLTAGFAIGYGEVNSKINVTVAGGNLAANPAFNAALPVGGANVPFVPLGAFGLTKPVAAADVQNLLSNRAFGLNYKPVQNSSWHSALDPIIGLRWRFQRDEKSATVFAPSLRIGVAKALDPNDLTQTALADGTTDILLGVMHTRRFGDNWDARLNAQYTVQLPDHILARSRSANELLVPSARIERLRRDRSDPVELAAEAGYRLGAAGAAGDWRVSGRLEYATGGKDRYRSPTGLDISGLEAGTDYHFTLGYVGVTWNGLRGYLAGTGAPPMVLSLAYGKTLSAKNTSAPDFINLTATLPF